MPQITLNRQDAEFGLLPTVCIVCGRTSAKTQSRRLFLTSRPGRGVPQPLGLFSRRLGRSLVMLVPVCSDHETARTFRMQSGVCMVALSADTVTLANVAEAFAVEWTAGAGRRIAPVAPLPWADSLSLNQRGGQAVGGLEPDLPDPIEPSLTPAKSRRRPAARRSSLWVLAAMVIVVVPLVIVSGLLFLSVMRAPRHRMPRAAPPWRQLPPGADRRMPAELQQRRLEANRAWRRARQQQQPAAQAAEANPLDVPLPDDRQRAE
jgi:hypothetical protein